jgi:hypothetical protein
VTEPTDVEWRASLPFVPDEARPLDPSSAVWRRGLVFASDGELVRVIDVANRGVFRLAGGGSDPAVAEGPAKLACFRSVTGIAVDDAGLWFCESGRGAVYRMSFASDSVRTLVDGLPEPVALARDGSVLYVACRQGELFEIDTTTTERRPLEAVGGVVIGIAIVANTLYAATESGTLLGLDRRSLRVTQRLELGGPLHSIAYQAPWLYLGLPGRIEQATVPDGSSKPLTRDGAVAQPHALAIVREYNKMFSSFNVTGLYFFDAGDLCWLDKLNSAVKIVLARGGWRD